MTKDDVIRLAREVGLCTWVVVPDAEVEKFYRFAELVKQHVQIEQMPKFEELAKTVREDELNRCIDILIRLHERASGTHNYYHYAANVLKGEI